MATKNQLEVDIINACCAWAREAMRRDLSLNDAEQLLMDSVIVYNNFEKNSIKVPENKTPLFPKPPKLPSDLMRSITPRESQMKTVRYSDIPTVPDQLDGHLAETVVYYVEEVKNGLED
jgi:hypothetical protein